MASTFRLPASMLDSALRGMPSFFATSSCLRPTYSRASLRRAPSTWRSASADGCEKPARSLLIGLLLLCCLGPGGPRLGYEVVDASLSTVVAALWAKRRREIDTQQFLDRADDFNDDQRIDVGLPRPGNAGLRCPTGAHHRMVCGLVGQRIPNARLEVSRGEGAGSRFFQQRGHEALRLNIGRIHT